MTATTLQSAIHDRYGEDVTVSHIEKKAWIMDEVTGQTWRDHLKDINERRLRGAKNRVVPESVVADLRCFDDEMRCFIAYLEVYTPDDELFHFSAESINGYFSGWVINDKIVYCIPRNRNRDVLFHKMLKQE